MIGVILAIGYAVASRARPLCQRLRALWNRQHPKRIHRHMTDRTEALLAELVEIQRKQLANQEAAAVRQEKVIAMQAQAVARSRKSLKGLWLVLAIACGAMILVPLLNYLARLGH
jgi:hypothetical protein